MIEHLIDTDTSEVSKRLVDMRDEGGAVALGRVLTLVIVTDRTTDEHAIACANRASGEHPMRIIVVNLNADDSVPSLDAEIRVGGDAGASEVIVLHANGGTATNPATLVQGLLLPDAPVVAWWPDQAIAEPSNTPIGRIAQLRITDSTKAVEDCTLANLAKGYRPGDTDLAWSRLTLWREQLAAVLDLPPFEPIESAEVGGAERGALPLLMAAWLHISLGIPVCIRSVRECEVEDLTHVTLRRASGRIELQRVSEHSVVLRQDGSPEQTLALSVRGTSEAFSEELRSVAADPLFGRVLTEGIPAVLKAEANGGSCER